MMPCCLLYLPKPLPNGAGHVDHVSGSTRSCSMLASVPFTTNSGFVVFPMEAMENGTFGHLHLGGHKLKIPHAEFITSSLYWSLFRLFLLMTIQPLQYSYSCSQFEFILTPWSQSGRHGAFMLFSTHLPSHSPNPIRCKVWSCQC